MYQEKTKMEELHAGRVLMGDSLGFHIVFALLGVGLALCMSIMEYLSIKRKDAALRENARLVSIIATILVVTGVVSGTVVALQMFLIWPGILDFGGEAVGMGFTLEGYFFIVEAVFLAFYMATWNRFKGYKHWALSLPIIIGSTGSAIMITAVNAWMNHPQGFDIDAGGHLINPKPVEALFTQTTLLQSIHSILAYYMTTALFVAGAYAYVLYRNKKLKVGSPKTARYIVSTFMLFSSLLMLVIIVFGDISAKYVAKHEPTKLAAIELLDKTQSNAPLIIGGTSNAEGGANGGVRINGGLSWLVGGSSKTEVKGLDNVPKSEWPPLFLHTLFTIKMVLSGVLVLILGLFALKRFRAPDKAYSKKLMSAVIAAPIISLTIVELGWMLTEIGRQPYAVYGHVLTADAFTTNQGVIALGWIFPTAFLVLFVLTIISIKLAINRFPGMPSPVKKGGRK